MAKRCKLTDLLIPPPSTSSGDHVATNWKLCVICQEETRENLVCPATSTRSDVGQGYFSLAHNIEQFADLQALPESLNVVRLDEGSGIEAAFKEHQAAWHKSCALKFNNTKLQRELKRKSNEDGTPSPVKTRSNFNKPDASQKCDKCFFCEKAADKHGLCKVVTPELDCNVRKCAREINDTMLLAKLSEGDMFARDAMYHPRCLVSLYNRRRSHASDPGTRQQEESLESIALVELISYIEDFRSTAAIAPVFKLVDLGKKFESRLQQLGHASPSRVNTTRLKDKILNHIPDLQVHRQGRDVLMMFNQDIGEAIKQASMQDFDNDAIHLMRAAQVVRHDLFRQSSTFNGSFDIHSQQKSVPTTLVALINMILEGTSIEQQSQFAVNKAATTISQLLVYNYVKHGRKESTTSLRHISDRETPVPIYLGLTIHAQTRKKTLVDTLHEMGLSISYKRVLTISTALANSVCKMFEEDQVVCPPKLRRNLFTTGAVDNVDHNPSSTTATDSFHGTAISLMQHPSEESSGVEREKVLITEESLTTRTVPPLPGFYTDIPPAILKTKEPKAPSESSNITVTDDQIDLEAHQDNYIWVENVEQLASTDTDNNDADATWAAHHASNMPDEQQPHTLIALLPLFIENAHYVAMILHAMNVVKPAVDHSNPGQTLVLTMDQPLIALAKQIQWNLPDTHGEIHIEIATLRALGCWLAQSGWTSAIV